MRYEDDLHNQAAEIGREHGVSAASWVFDGNTTQETYRRVFDGIESGDPEVMDAFREPSLSGEFADDYSTQDLQDDLGIEIDWTRDDTQAMSELMDECATAYLDAASQAFWEEVERLAQSQLAKDES